MIQLIYKNNQEGSDPNFFACLQLLSWDLDDSDLGSGSHVCEFHLDEKRIEEAHSYLSYYLANKGPPQSDDGYKDETPK